MQYKLAGRVSEDARLFVVPYNAEKRFLHQAQIENP